MAVAPALGDPVVMTDETTGQAPGEAEDSSSRPSGSPGSRLFRVILLGVLVVALVASVVTAAVLWSHRRGHADALQASREAAMAQTQQFVLRANTYDPSMLDSQG